MLCDFDGCLAPIVSDPQRSVVYPASLVALGELENRLGLVGIVSGRPVAFLKQAVALSGIAYVGHHGLERLGSGALGDEIVIDPRALEFLERVQAATIEAAERLPGVLIERKGGVSLALHWRTAPELGTNADLVGREIAASHGLAVLSGRRALELRPPVPVDKGDAVVALTAGHQVALFAGDDITDLAAFDALDSLVASGTLEHAIRVGVTSQEAVGELLSRADIIVEGPEGLAELLESLVLALTNEEWPVRS